MPATIATSDSNANAITGKDGDHRKVDVYAPGAHVSLWEPDDIVAADLYPGGNGKVTLHAQGGEAVSRPPR